MYKCIHIPVWRPTEQRREENGSLIFLWVSVTEIIHPFVRLFAFTGLFPTRCWSQTHIYICGCTFFPLHILRLQLMFLYVSWTFINNYATWLWSTPPVGALKSILRSLYKISQIPTTFFYKFVPCGRYSYVRILNKKHL